MHYKKESSASNKVLCSPRVLLPVQNKRPHPPPTFTSSTRPARSSRLRLSPSPPPTRVTSRTGSGSAGGVAGSAAALSRTVHCSAQSSSAKRRRANDTDSEASSFAGGPAVRTRVTQQASASGRVTVDEVDQEGKFVKLGNKADEVRPRRRRWLMLTCSMCGSVLLLWSYDTVDMLLVGSVGIEPQNLGTGSVNGMLLPSRDSPIVSCHI